MTSNDVTLNPRLNKQHAIVSFAFKLDRFSTHVAYERNMEVSVSSNGLPIVIHCINIGRDKKTSKSILLLPRRVR